MRVGAVGEVASVSEEEDLVGEVDVLVGEEEDLLGAVGKVDAAECVGRGRGRRVRAQSAMWASSWTRWAPRA